MPGVRVQFLPVRVCGCICLSCSCPGLRALASLIAATVVRVAGTTTPPRALAQRAASPHAAASRRAATEACRAEQAEAG